MYICPMLSKAGEVATECIQERCGWFNEVKSKCIVVEISEQLDELIKKSTC